MWHLVETSRSYPPETVAVMTVAYEKVCQFLSPSISSDDDVRRRLALIILRHVDLGERDPARLSDAALIELTGADRSAAM